jgi:hypothetical protein
MSKPLILVTMAIYAYVAGEQLHKGNVAGCVMWGAYSVANLGLYLMTK